MEIASDHPVGERNFAEFLIFLFKWHFNIWHFICGVVWAVASMQATREKESTLIMNVDVLVLFYFMYDIHCLSW